MHTHARYVWSFGPLAPALDRTSPAGGRASIAPTRHATREAPPRPNWRHRTSKSPPQTLGESKKQVHLRVLYSIGVLESRIRGSIFWILLVVWVVEDCLDLRNKQNHAFYAQYEEYVRSSFSTSEVPVVLKTYTGVLIMI